MLDISLNLLPSNDILTLLLILSIPPKPDQFATLSSSPTQSRIMISGSSLGYEASPPHPPHSHQDIGTLRELKLMIAPGFFGEEHQCNQYRLSYYGIS